MFIRTERLFLRPVFEEDWREILAGIGEEAVVRMLARAPWPYAASDAREFCARPHDPRLPTFAVTLPGMAGAPLIGVCGFHEEDEGIEFGYWIAPGRWGRGYATEAGRAALEVVRATRVRRVLAGHYLDNPASGKVLRKLGFAETGEVRPTFCRARGGEMVLARRFALELCGVDGSLDAAMPKVA
ncbi:MAG: hypothetical protein B7Z08_10710 [Sphingomonadales bacterium 32-68-7]|nr:MAG: hypothetical protein B7Z33_12565 [Sphingomonadales bacterium 12-68-11]OYX08140.1 MAG: hypothetical protein B7Z08_10710 [Sphingomonadales bacterium 32-68-7]